MKRRNFLKLGTTFALVPLLGQAGTKSSVKPFSQKLPIPRLASYRMKNGVKIFDLKIQEGEKQFFKGVDTDTYGVNADYLGETIRVHDGDRVRINVQNDLDEMTTLHWHGLKVSGTSDGGPHSTIPKGTTWQADMTIGQHASTCWYHPHTKGQTGRQVFMGMAGLFIIDDPVSTRLPLPDHYGVNDITHELNTPITALSMTASQALKRGQCTGRQLNNIDISTKQLYDIYRSLTYLNFDEQSMADEVSDVGVVLHKSIAYYRSLAEMKQIDFDVAVSASLYYPIPEQKLSLLFGNLIGNAIKYSSARSVIHLKLEERHFTIRDYGIGILDTDQQMIFRRYRRGTKQSGGFGIGLNIVKSICDQHGIEIRLDSALGEGTTFALFFGDAEDLHEDYAIVTR